MRDDEPCIPPDPGDGLTATTGVTGADGTTAATGVTGVADETTPATEGDRRREAADEVVIEALATGRTYDQAARLAGCSPRTVRRRVADPQFRAELAQRRGQHTIELIGAMTALETTAVRVLADCLNGERPADQLKAVALVMSAAARLRATADVDDRLTAQEAALAVLLDAEHSDPDS